ncbi:MAG: hypothetical protein HUJ68_10045 [Clostridia bacterium]|nr:hypothetical protein [Clostridia bacterium]
MQFILKKDEISRLKVFNSYLKNMNNCAALKKEQLFVVRNNKLSVYGSGSSGNITADFDVDSNDTFVFTFEFSQFLNFIDKVNSDETTITFNDSKLIFTGSNTGAKYSQVVLNTIEETAKADMAAMDDFTTSNAYNNAVTITLDDDIKETIANMSSMANLLNCNKFIKIVDDGVVTVDNVSIIKKSLTINTNGQEFYLLRSVSPLLKDASDIKICNLYSSDEYFDTYIYLDISSLGIKLWFVEPPVDFQIPKDEEIAEMSPTDDSASIIEINSEDFFNCIEKFEGVFDSASWKYKQIKFDFDETDTSKVLIHYDNMVSEIQDELPIANVEQNKISSSLFLIPTLHMKYLKEDLLKEGSFKFKFDFSDEHFITHVQNSFLDAALTKVEG